MKLCLCLNNVGDLIYSTLMELFDFKAHVPPQSAAISALFNVINFLIQKYLQEDTPMKNLIFLPLTTELCISPSRVTGNMVKWPTGQVANA